ncbi:MAG TPA: ShlB/FhaC/HecB family hemolysin secretion/activation protein [Solimonas sp.]
MDRLDHAGFPRSHCWIAAALMSVAGTVGAQTLTPGAVGDTLPKPPITQAPATPSIQRESAASAAPVAASATRITVSRFIFEGNTRYSAEELGAVVASFVGRPITLLDVYAAADLVAEHYARNGYTLASVNVPPQKIEQGSVQLQISEGRLARVETEGNRIYSDAQILGQIAARPGEVYRGTDLERNLRTLNASPGLQVRATVRPGTEYGTSDLLLRATEKRFEGGFSVDNYGRDSIGEIRYALNGQINNPLRLADQLQLMALTSEDGLLTYGYGGYSLPLNNKGTRFQAALGYAKFEVRDTPVEGENLTGRLTLEHPLLSTQDRQLIASIGVATIDANSDFSGVLLNDTLVTVLEVGARYSYSSPSTGITQVSTQIATNFQQLTRQEIATAQLAGRRLDGDQRLRLELDAQQLMPLAAGFEILGHLNGVYSPDPLVDTQQYSLGGPGSVRGFLPSEIRGDRGYFGSLTLQRPMAFGAVRITPRLFADSGTVFVVDAPNGVSERESLTSVGIGTDLQYQRLGIKLDWSFPTDRHIASDGKDDHRLFGALSASF